MDRETQDLVGNCKTLEEIQEVILGFNEKKLKTSKAKIIELENKLFGLNESFIYLLGVPEIMRDRYEFENVKSETSTCKNNLTREKKNCDEINRGV